MRWRTKKSRIQKKRSRAKRLRGPNKLYSTEAARALYALFVKPFFNAFTLRPDQDYWREGLEHFFSIHTRKIVWYRAEQSFYMPGSMWASLSHPYVTVQGTGSRYVAQGKGLWVRTDEAMPDRNEVEFEDQVFVLTNAELQVIKEKLKAVA